MNRILVPILFALGVATTARAADTPPNVVVVITDDQGFGDLGVHGNPVLKTPHLDLFAKNAVWLKNFTVSPVCAPTRAALLTGQYAYRTGVVDTYLGRALMRPDVKTLPEYLAAAGYRTGLFGKWHLGDNYPLRPEDRGFRHTLWCQGGGLAQPSDPPGQDPKTAYFNPTLKTNGKDEKTVGYCTDVFTDAAIRFVTAEPGKPFFAYVAYNAPHDPFQVPEDRVTPYKRHDLTANGFPKIGRPWANAKLDTDKIARAYGMIENLDDNFGRLMKALAGAKLTDNTIVVFLGDNGPGGVRFNGGLRDRKGSVYEGGIRVPCYVRWPARVKPATIDIPLASIDLTPTLLAACGVNAGGFDGVSFLPLLRRPLAAWGHRTLFTQWHRGDVPEKYRAFAARGPQYKLVQAAGTAPGPKWEPKFELFDLAADLFEEKDVAADRPEVVAQMKRQYDGWFADVTKKGFDPPRIIVGNDKENPVRLSRQDWRGPKAGWAAESDGEWYVKVERTGVYQATLVSKAEFRDYELFFCGHSQGGVGGTAGKTVTFDVSMTAGDTIVSATVGDAKASRGADYVELKYLRK